MGPAALGQPPPAGAVIARPVDGLRAHPQAQGPKIGADRRRRPALGEALAHRGGQLSVGGQLGGLGPGRPGAGPSLRRPRVVAARAFVAPQLALHRHRVAAQPTGRLRRADPRLGHRLDPSALLKTKTPCHTENLHRLVAAMSPAIMVDQLQPPVETAAI